MTMTMMLMRTSARLTMTATTTSPIARPPGTIRYLSPDAAKQLVSFNGRLPPFAVVDVLRGSLGTCERRLDANDKLEGSRLEASSQAGIQVFAAED
jgi:hypothetical protein